MEHYSDSELLVRQLNGQYRVKAGNLKPLFGKVSTLSKKFGSVNHHVCRTDKRLGSEIRDGSRTKMLRHEFIQIESLLSYYFTAKRLSENYWQ